MKKIIGFMLTIACLIVLLTGCTAVGDKTAPITVAYAVTATASFAMLAGYCFLPRKKDAWLSLLFVSVFVVNAGYLAIALSDTLNKALFANRIAYLGSACLPLTMLMLIANACGLKFSRKITAILAGISIMVFLVAATPGYLDIYYKEASLGFINGMAVIEKVYGEWHCLYLIYLIVYFAAMLGVIAWAVFRKRLKNPLYAVMLTAVVFVNIGVWFVEQLVRIEFEVLSVSYIISELMLLGLCLTMQNPSEKTEEIVTSAEPLPCPESCRADACLSTEPKAAETAADNPDPQLSYFASQISTLTPTENIIYNLYLKGRSTKEIMAELNIKENTLKYHNKNIYGKLGVSSRKQLVEIARAIAKV